MHSPGLSALPRGSGCSLPPGLPDRTQWGTRSRGSPEPTCGGSHARSWCGLDAVRCQPGEAGTRGCGHCPGPARRPHTTGEPCGRGSGEGPHSPAHTGLDGCPKPQAASPGGWHGVRSQTGTSRAQCCKDPPARRQEGLSKVPASAWAQIKTGRWLVSRGEEVRPRL